MKFWEGYWKSLKPLEVEEPIDVWVHRPLAYLIARASFPIGFVTPNAITVVSIVLGIAAGAMMLADQIAWAGILLFSSAVFDCADGQLARLRGTSSAFGRMLDGAADLVVSVAASGGGTYLVWREYAHSPAYGALAVALCLITIGTSSFHTSSYDHYKNVFLRLTHPSYREGEDYEQALERAEKARAEATPFMRAVWRLYVFYVRTQTEYVRGFDPLTARLGAIPSYSPEGAAIYRRRAGGAMRVWRCFFGFGSLVFGMSVSIGLGFVEYYLWFRLIVLNLLFYGYARPRQRRASTEALRDMGSAAPG